MKPIAEITDKRVARGQMLEHVGFPSDAPEPWPARGRARGGRRGRATGPRALAEKSDYDNYGPRLCRLSPDKR